MPSKLILDQTEPGINEVVAGAKQGVELVLREVRVLPTLVSPQAFEADVVHIKIEDEVEEPEEMEESPETAEPASLGKIPRTNPKKASGFDEGSF